jgi:hypothetical protein
MSDSVTKSSRFTLSEQSESYKSTVSESNCMEAINKQFKEKGFSSSTRKLLTASWRTGTRKDYTCKLKKFSSWCNTKQIDPYKASFFDGLCKIS